jgi:hemolysin D
MNIQKFETLQDQPVILEQPAFWSRAFIWLIVVMTASTLIWAALAKIDQSVPAAGKLEPEGSLKELFPPDAGGVVRKIHVKGGQEVKKGDLLVTFDPTTTEADVESLKGTQDVLQQEATAIGNNGGGSVGGGTANLASLTQQRAALASENEFLKAQVSGGAGGGLVGGAFDANQEQLLNQTRAEESSRAKVSAEEQRALREQIDVLSAQRQASVERATNDAKGLASTGERLDRAKARLFEAQDRIVAAESRLSNTRARVVTAQERLAKEREILERIRPVVEQGAVAELQLNRQEQQVLSAQDTVLSLQSEIANTESEIASTRESMAGYQGEIATIEAEIADRETRIDDANNEAIRLEQEAQRIQAQIGQTQAQLENTFDTSDREALARIAANQRLIAQIDDQLTQQKLNNERQSVQASAELTKAQKALDYRELRSPVDGIIFKIGPSGEGIVVRPGDPDPVVAIIPDAKLVANVFVTNQDIGFIEEGMKVEVQIEAFPATEFGTIPGTLKSIGKDVLEPEPTRDFYAFPIRVEMGQQYLELRSGKHIPLQSGMAVQANIKVRDRTVLSIFLDKFLSQKDALEEVR